MKEVEWLDDIPCPGQACSYYKAGQCKELMTLQFLLPRVPGLGVWQLDTSSWHGMVNINSGLALVRSMFGRVSGVPLTLTLEPMEVRPDGLKKTVRVLQLRSRETMERMLQEPASTPMVALPSPDVVDAPAEVDETKTNVTSRRWGSRPMRPSRTSSSISALSSRGPSSRSQGRGGRVSQRGIHVTSGSPWG